MRSFKWTMLLAAVAGLAMPALAQRKVPYWVSLNAGKVHMRTGPGRNYPVSWLYQRRDLPAKVVDTYREWRKVEDPDGTEGWILGALLSEARTAMVRGATAEMRSAPRFDSRISWRAAPGVVGRISRCASGWCWFDVNGRAGYIEQSHIWGVDPGEVLN